jgi:tripartite-type tricarboxylate transporter receptor subunit TctC
MLKVASERGLTFASSGTATPGHFAGEVLKLKTASKLTHVPYNGAGPALNDLSAVMSTCSSPAFRPPLRM